MAKFDWSALATKLPMIIGTAINVVDRVKSASGPEKEAAVLSSIPVALQAAEDVAGKDLIYDPAIQQLMQSYITARVALQNGVTAAQHARTQTPPQQ